MIRIVEFRLKHLQVSNFESRRCKWHLKVHRDWRSRPLLFGICLQEFNFSRNLRLFHSAHPFNFPDNGIFRGLIFGLAFHANKLNTRCVERRWDSNLDLLGQKRRLEIGFNHNFDLQFCPTNFSHQRNHAKRQRNVFGGAIPAKIG